MKILFLQDDFPPQSFGGAGISTYDLAISMKNAGHEVSVITTCRKQNEAGRFDYEGLKIFKIVSNYPDKWRAYLSLNNKLVVCQVEKILKSVRPDVVHANNIHFYLSYHSLKIAKQYAGVVVITLRDVMAFNFTKLNTKRYLKNFDYHTTWWDHFKQAKKRWNPFRNFFIKRYLRYTDKVFAVSDALKDALEQNGIKNVEVIHTGIDVDLWQVDEKEKIRFVKKYNLTDKKVILFGGRLSDAKGGTKVLEALAQIVKEAPNTVLLVAGGIDGHARVMKKQAENLGLEKNLVFTGWAERKEIKIMYAVSDIVLVPSICFDSFPRVVLEAMVSSKPIIGTCYGGASEAIIDGITGYIVNPTHLEEITKKILYLLRNPEKAKEFGKNGYKRVKEDFNLRDKINEYIAVYETLLV